MEHTDVCFAPVLSLAEAPEHPHNVARGTFVDLDGVVQPAPAPRFSATPGACSARRPTPASTPTRSSPTGASSPTASPSCARPAPSREHVASLRGDGDARFVPRPSRRRVHRDRRHARQGRASGSPHRPGVRHQGRARRGARRLPRRRRDAGAAARAGDGAVGGDPRRPARRVPRLHRLRDDGHARERPRGLVLDRRCRGGGRAAGRDPPRGGGRRAHRLRQRRQLRAPRPHPGAPRRPAGRRAGRHAPGVRGHDQPRPHQAGDAGGGRGGRAPRRGRADPRRLRDLRSARVDDHHHGRRPRVLDQKRASMAAHASQIAD